MKIGLVCTTNLSHNISEWIHHHLNIGIDFIFLNIDSQYIPSYIQNNNKIKFFKSSSEKNDYEIILNQQTIQIDFVNYCIRQYCISNQFNFLLHLDDDELFVLNKKYKNIQEYLLNNDSEKINYIRIQNFEAVLLYSPISNDYFKTTIYFKDPLIDNFNGYKNGKSIGKISSQLICNGCHTFEGNYKIMDRRDGIILHFDCVTFEKWFQKFSKFKYLSDDVYSKIPFSFYKKSIDLIKNVSDINKLKQFWHSHLYQSNNPININREYKIIFEK
jgi:hypothetical protein